MDGHFILKRDNPQVAALQLGNRAPEPVPIVLLGSGSNRVVENASAPLFLDVRPLAKDLFLEIFGVTVLSHLDRLPQSGHALDVAA